MTSPDKPDDLMSIFPSGLKLPERLVKRLAGC